MSVLKDHESLLNRYDHDCSKATADLQTSKQLGYKSQKTYYNGNSGHDNRNINLQAGTQTKFSK